jgi:ABC-type branched-subunit amino acid transport system permease subunit
VRGVQQQISIGLVFLLLAMAPLCLPSYHLALLTQAVISAMLAMSLDLLLGYTGLASLGHAAYLGVGAYSVVLPRSTVPTSGLRWPLGLPGYRGGGIGLVVRATGVYFDDHSVPRYGRLGAGATLGVADQGITALLGFPGRPGPAMDVATSTSFYYLV